MLGIINQRSYFILIKFPATSCAVRNSSEKCIYAIALSGKWPRDTRLLTFSGGKSLAQTLLMYDPVHPSMTRPLESSSRRITRRSWIRSAYGCLVYRQRLTPLPINAYSVVFPKCLRPPGQFGTGYTARQRLVREPRGPVTGSEAGKGSRCIRCKASGEGALRQMSQVCSGG